MGLAPAFGLLIAYWRCQGGAVDDRAKQLSESQLLEEEIAALIMGYFEEHPQAMDTLEGIAEWWLMRERVRVEVETLSRVVRQLTERDLVEVSGVGQYMRYRLKTSTDQCARGEPFVRRSN
jgi:hypothetical protein